MTIDFTKTYAYTNIDLVRVYIEGPEIIDLGSWLPQLSYTPGQVVSHAGAFYLCLRANTGLPPQGILDEYWSPLVEIREDEVFISSAGTDVVARDLATTALSTAEDALSVATSGSNLAWEAYLLAQEGTDGALAEAAWILAQVGTTAAEGAFDLAELAWNLSQIGTDAAEAALLLAQSGSDTAVQALDLAQSAYDQALNSGDMAASAFTEAQGAFDLAESAWELAQVGTDAAEVAFQTATSGSNLAWDAYLLAQESGGGVLAQEAWNLAQIGTDAAASAISGADAAFTLAVSGTTAAQGAFDLAENAWNLAQVGTQVGSQALGVAQEALAAFDSLAVQGRCLLVALCSAYTPESTGPDPAEVVVPFDYDGSIPVDWTVRRTTLRVATAGGAPSARLEKSSGVGIFNATALTTITVGSNTYEASQAGIFGTVTSGDKLRMNVLDTGSAQHWFFSAQLYHPLSN